MPNGDFGGGFDFGGLFDSLLGGLVAIIDAIIAFLNALVAAIVNALNFLFAGELGIFGFAVKTISEIWKGLKNLMDQVFKVWVLAALKHLKDLFNKLQAWAKKLKRWLDLLRKLQKQQMQAFRRIINLIQRVRQVLAVFKLLGFKWAKKLDAWLVNIEGKLIRHELEIVAKTNEIIGWINFLVDPTALFKLSPLAQSIYRYLRGLRGVLGIPESRALTVDEETRQSQDRALLTSTPKVEDAAMQRILVGLDDAVKVYVP